MTVRELILQLDKLIAADPMVADLSVESEEYDAEQSQSYLVPIGNSEVRQLPDKTWRVVLVRTTAQDRTA